MGGPGSGRKPKPTALKILSGVRADRINGTEPALPPVVPDPPKYLSAQARDFWVEHAEMLARCGVLTEADRHALGLLADSFARWRQDPDDHKRRDEFRRLLVEFGMTPAARSSIKVPPALPADPLADFLKKA